VRTAVRPIRLVEATCGASKQRARVGWWLFATVALVYAATSPGNLPGDAEVRWSVSRQLWRGEAALEEEVGTFNYAVGEDGRRYSFYGLGQSLLMAPFAGLALVLAGAGVEAATADLVGQFLASVLLFPALGALGVYLLYRLALCLELGQRPAVLTALVAGLGTMHWHYSVNGQEQTQVAALVLLALLLMEMNLERGRFGYRLLLCGALGAALLFRLSALVVVGPIYVVAAASEVLRSSAHRRGSLVGEWLGALVLGMGPFLGVIGWYNYARFGGVLESGYGLALATALGGHGLFESEPMGTLAAMVVSPGKGIVLYNPVLVLAVIGLWGLWGRSRALALGLLGAVAGSFVFHGFFTAWAGDYAWSVRYQAVVVGLMVLPLGLLWERLGGYWQRGAVAAVVGLSVAVQLASVAYNFNLEFTQQPNHGIVPDGYVWRWSESHLVGRWVNIGRHVTGQRDFSSEVVAQEEPYLYKVNYTPEAVERAYTVNWFPFKAVGFLGAGALGGVLLAGWLMVLVLAGVSAALLVRAVRRARGQLV